MIGDRSMLLPTFVVTAAIVAGGSVVGVGVIVLVGRAQHTLLTVAHTAVIMAIAVVIVVVMMFRLLVITRYGEISTVKLP